jgi:hypothetical protein
VDRYEKRTKGYRAQVIDSERLTKHIHKILELTYGQFTGLENCMVEPLVFTELSEKDSWGNSRVAIIGTEGVGWQSDLDSRIVLVPVYYNGGMSNARPVEIHKDLLSTFATDEWVDLADWVRIFGDRLESNLWLWQTAMPTPIPAE